MFWKFVSGFFEGVVRDQVSSGLGSDSSLGRDIHGHGMDHDIWGSGPKDVQGNSTHNDFYGNHKDFWGNDKESS